MHFWRNQQAISIICQSCKYFRYEFIIFNLGIRSTVEIFKKKSK